MFLETPIGIQANIFAANFLPLISENRVRTDLGHRASQRGVQDSGVICRLALKTGVGATTLHNSHSFRWIECRTKRVAGGHDYKMIIVIFT